MSWYSTPLQFAYFFSLILCGVFTYRGWLREQLNLKFLGFLMLIFALELQDYTFGFSGINILWEDLKGFPRGVALLFGPALLFYLRSQVNRNLKLRARDLWHLLPWAVFFFAQLIVFLQGPEVVERVSQREYYAWLLDINTLIRWLSIGYYFYQAWILLGAYQKWMTNQFSSLETVSLAWFRNFLALMSLWVLFRELMGFIDGYYDLPFYQDWWWNLALAFAAVYVGISGLSQAQPADMVYNQEPEIKEKGERQSIEQGLMEVVDDRMQSDRYYLQPDLSIRELAAQLKISVSDLSQAINQEKQANFNDYINAWRVEEFIREYPKEENRQYTILSIALDSGFNSKATFHRAFKKVTGQSPREYFAA